MSSWSKCELSSAIGRNDSCDRTATPETFVRTLRAVLLYHDDGNTYKGLKKGDSLTSRRVQGLSRR
jgi:hypothetical protein